jgi:hypothetical protein
MSRPRLGERLVADGLLPASAIRRALGFQSTAAPHVRLGSILLTWDLIDESSLLSALAAFHRCAAVTGEMLANAPVDLVKLLPAPQAVRWNALPYALERSRMRVAFVDPSDVRAIDEVSARTGRACVAGVATELRMLQAHRRFYGRVLPAELRAPIPRSPGARPSRVEGPPPVRISVQAETAPAEETAAPPPITIPRLPVPEPPPRESRPPAAASDASVPAGAAAPAAETASSDSLWMDHLPEIAPSALALGMWSDPAEAPRMTREELGDIALSNVPPDFPRALLLAREGGRLVGWRVRGLPAERLPEIRIPSSEPSVFASVLETGTPHFGRVDDAMWPAALGKVLEGPPPCAVFPVHAARGVPALIYADRRGAPMRFEDTALLARAAAGIAALFEREPFAPGPE